MFNPLYLVQSFRLDQRVRRCAKILDDTVLYAKLQNGDMIAQDEMYRRPCLLDLYRKASTSQLEGHYSDKERQLHGIAFSEIVAFLETSCISVEDEIPVFRLSDLNKFYCERLEELGLKLEVRVHSSRLKNRILSQFDDLTSYNEGREALLAFNSDVGEALTSAASINYDDEGFILAKAGTIIRRDILGSKHSEFEGGFSPECQESYVPAPIQSFVSMIMRGPSADHSNNPYFKQVMLSISQHLMFNTTIRTRSESSSSYHSTETEPPIAVYLAQRILSHTRKLNIVDSLCHLGLCISGDRLLDISASMGNRAIEQYKKDSIVCPLNLQLGLFATAAVDNIDVNPSSNQAMPSFHGTAASLHQHIEGDVTGHIREMTSILPTEKKLRKLPSNYVDIPHAHLPSSISIPESKYQAKVTTDEELDAFVRE